LRGDRLSRNGVEQAQLIKASGLCLEEYLAQ